MRFFLAILIAAFAFSVRAEDWKEISETKFSVRADWKEISETDKGDRFFIDPATIKEKGNFRKAWIISDLSKKLSIGVLSIRQLEEFDCAEVSSRAIVVTTFSKHFADGEIVYGTNIPAVTFTPIQPDTAWKDVLDFVCNYKIKTK